MADSDSSSNSSLARRARAIFEDLIELADDSKRESVIQRRCAGDAEMESQVRSLMAIFAEDTRDFLDTDCLRNALPDTRPEGAGKPGSMEKPGDLIGRYLLAEEIGSGGFGVVYRAEQLEPIRRDVALKILKPGLDTREIVGRFEAERQALALMDHPGITQVFDAGVTQTGRPYFAMELIDGPSIVDFCRERKLSTEQRLQVFLKVCDAVQHAHQKGVIHRDLKPSNILIKSPVVRPGADGPPAADIANAACRIIDFGIAKATGSRLTEETLATSQGRMMGTPQYMSPEQAGLNSADIDTRSDIYSLGAILYELLTGSPPLNTSRLRGSSLTEIERLIQEEDPSRPSTRMTDWSESTVDPASSASRSAPRVRGFANDLDWITLKALEKDRSRRYQSVEALTADIRRHLASEPVLATPPSTVYRIRKYVRRHRAAVVATAASLAAILALSVAFIVKLVASERTARASADEAIAAKARADLEVEKSLQVAQFLKDTLSAAGPSKALGRDAGMMKDILDKTAERIGSELAGRPEVQAELRGVIGATYHDLDEYARAIEQHREALRLNRELFEGDHPEVAGSLTALSTALEHQGLLKEAEAAGSEGVAMWRRLVASNDPRLAAAESDIAWLLLKSGRAAEGEEMAARAFEVWRANPGDQRLSEIPTALAFIYKHTGRNALATPILREELARLREWHGAEHPTIANALDNFGMHLVALGENEEAEAVLREALAQGRKFHGDRSPHEDHVLARLATLAKRRGDLDAQLDLSRRAMEAGARVYAEGHRYRSESQRQYARTLLEQAELYLDRGLAEGATSVGNESRYLSLASERLATLAASESLMSASRADRPWMQCLLIAIKILKSNELHAPDSENRNRLKESWTASATAVNEKKNATGDQKRRAKKVRTYTVRLFESGSRAGKRGEKGD